MPEKIFKNKKGTIGYWNLDTNRYKCEQHQTLLLVLALPTTGHIHFPSKTGGHMSSKIRAFQALQWETGNHSTRL